MPSRAEGLIPDLLCPGSHQGVEVTLLDMDQAALAPPEVWDVRDGEKHSPQLPGHGSVLPGQLLLAWSWVRAGVNDLLWCW